MLLSGINILMFICVSVYLFLFFFSDRSMHPYCAASTKEFLGWNVGKRRAAEVNVSGSNPPPVCDCCGVLFVHFNELCHLFLFSTFYPTVL